MVYRDYIPIGSPDRVFFVVHDQDGNRVNAATLDRYGISFNQAFQPPGGTFPNNPDAGKFGTPGVDFNNHVPSNCIACHGGTYDSRLPFAVSAAATDGVIDRAR
jgi:hypothetical protein